MQLYPAVIVHGMADARLAMRSGRPVTLLSGEGAGFYAGCLWWRALVGRIRAEFPDIPMFDVLDCADGSGQALAALRIGVTRLVLWPSAPGRAALDRIARAHGGVLLHRRPELF